MRCLCGFESNVVGVANHLCDAHRAFDEYDDGRCWYACPACPKSFQSYKWFVKHLKVHGDNLEVAMAAFALTGRAE